MMRRLLASVALLLLASACFAGSGVVTTEYGSDTVADNSCAAYMALRPGFVTSCSSDPLVAGTVLTWVDGTETGTITVVSVTATAGSSDSVPLDWSNVSHLLQAGLVVFACYMVFRGYESGLRQ